MTISPYRIPYDTATWGTSASLGYRMGVPAPDTAAGYFNQDVTQTPYTGNNIPLSSYYDQFGAGMFQSPLFTYCIRPGRTTYSDFYPVVVDIASSRTLTLADIADNTIVPLTLLGSQLTNCAAVKVTTGANSSFLQLDVPRSVAIYGDLLASSSDTDLYVWIYGTDFYGLPKTYMAALSLNPEAPSGLLMDTPTCFYTITGIQIGSTNFSDMSGTVDIVTGFNFGLPYRLDQMAHVIGYSQGDAVLSGISPNNNNVEASYLYPNGYVVTSTPPPALGSVIPWGLALPVEAVIATTTADSVTTGLQIGTPYLSPQGLITADTRGFVHPTLYSDWSQANPVGATLVAAANFPAGATLTMTYYVAGADMFQQQMNVTRGLWYALPGQSSTTEEPPVSRLGYQQFAAFDGGIPDPTTVLALKGAIPYYEPPSAATIPS